MNRLRWLALLMVIAIIGITGFQAYWLKDNYAREKQSLDIKTNAAFRQTILKLQASKLRLEEINLRMDSARPEIRLTSKSKQTEKRATWVAKNPATKEPPITLINLIQQKAKEYENKDSIRSRVFISGYVDSLPASFKDSVKSIMSNNGGTTVRRFTMARHLDSIPPESIKEVRVLPGTQYKNEMVVNYTSEGSGQHVREDLMLRRPLPPGANMMMPRIPVGDGDRNAFIQMIYSIDSLSVKDSVTIAEADSAFRARLSEENIQLAFKITKLDSSYGNSLLPNEVTLGLSVPVTYRLNLLNPSRYVLSQLKLPILFSFLLVGITIASFVLLYRNLLKQHRLTQMKNDLISNITHELKTPIATVGVAIEALKSFNAMDDPKRTREYLDISQNEIQRLELLVDKVLKLSIFENRQITLQKEKFDLQQLVNEVMASMKFQADKLQANLQFETEGNNFLVNADKLHITSVVYNLLDNALKYSGEKSSIKIHLKSDTQHAELRVSDNGKGIPAEYREKIFDKFFRVPDGDRHNIKGYGLGLSYVDHIIQSHQGSVEVLSELGKGSTFIVRIPFGYTAQAHMNSESKILKEGFQS